MRRILMRSLKLLILPALCLALTATSSFAQASQIGMGSRIQLEALSKLEARAEQVVDVNIDERLLKLIPAFLKDTNPDEKKVKEIISGIKGVYVRVYEFRSRSSYTTDDVEPIRSQLKNPAWVRVAGVRSTREGQNIEIFTYLENNQIGGLAVIAAEDDQLTVVNIVGLIDVEKLVALGGKFNIPEFKIKIDTSDEGTRRRP